MRLYTSLRHPYGALVVAMRLHSLCDKVCSREDRLCGGMGTHAPRTQPCRTGTRYKVDPAEPPSWRGRLGSDTCHAVQVRRRWAINIDVCVVNVNVNELRLGFSNTTRNPEGILSQACAAAIASATLAGRGTRQRPDLHSCLCLSVQSKLLWLSIVYLLDSW
jgi:hypothetical protein